MEPELLLRIIAVIVGISILLFTLVDFNWMIDKLLNKETVKVVPETKKDDKSFLHIVDLWYKLKASCEAYGLNNACEKLDEVFPLLNDKSQESENE
jgi:hypothetical protein